MENRIYIFIFWGSFSFCWVKVLRWWRWWRIYKERRVRFSKIDWSVLYEKIAADSQVPDQRDVLMLLDYHRDDPVRCESLLRRLNGGKAYYYIANWYYRNCRYRKETASNDGKRSKAGIWSETAKLLPVNFAGGELIMVNREKSVMESEKVWRQTVLAVKNNLLYDLALAPNIEVEIPLVSVGLWILINKCPWWLNSREEFYISCFREGWKDVTGY